MATTLDNLSRQDMASRLPAHNNRAAFDAIVAHFSRYNDWGKQLLNCPRTKKLLGENSLLSLEVFQNSPELVCPTDTVVRVQQTLRAEKLNFVRGRRFTSLTEKAILDRIDSAVDGAITGPAGIVELLTDLPEVLSKPDPLFWDNSVAVFQWTFRVRFVSITTLKDLREWTPEIPSPTS